MVVLSILQICLASIVVTATTPRNGSLGKGFWLPATNLAGPLGSGASVFDSIPARCIQTLPDLSSQRDFVSYLSTSSAYRHLTTSTGLDASLKGDYTLGFTLDVVSKNIAGSSREVRGTSLLISADVATAAVNKDCLNTANFSQQFLADLEKLDAKIDKPWSDNSWLVYEAFLRKYGSHIVTSVTFGSMINQMVFSKWIDFYTERDLQVAACAKFLGATEAGMAQVSLCSNVTDEELSQSSQKFVSDTLTVTGGTPETRNKLLTQNRTSELIERFLSEANATRSPIKYKFEPVWEHIQSRYLGKSDNFIRGINLEFFYHGYKNFGCPFRLEGGQVLQAFNFTIGSTSTMPEYECSIAPLGCHSDDDCHYHLGVWCYCGGSGPSCVNYEWKVSNTQDFRLTPFIDHSDDVGWHGCDWKLWGSSCACEHPSTERKVVWQKESKYLLHKAHVKLMQQRQMSKSKNIKEEL